MLRPPKPRSKWFPRGAIRRAFVAAAIAIAAAVIGFLPDDARRVSRARASAALSGKTSLAVTHCAWPAADQKLVSPATVTPTGSALALSSEELRARLRRLVDSWTLAENDDDRARLIEAIAGGLDVRLAVEALSQLAEIDGLPESLERALFVRLAELAPYTAVELLEKTILPGQRRDAVKIAVGAQWAEADLAAAIVWVAHWPEGALQNTATENLVAQFTVATLEDLADFGAIIPALPRGPMKTELLNGLVQQWGAMEFSGALAWAQCLENPAEQERALLHLSHRWGETARNDALAFAHTLPEGRDALVVTLVGQWAQTEPQAAANWATSLPEGPRREKALSSLLAVWAQQDPRAARDFLLQLAPSPARSDAAVSILAAWAAQEPAVAAQWAERFPGGRERDYAIENVAYRWVQSDPVAAVGWLQRLPAGRERDVALHASAGSLVEAYPDLAAQMAAGIGDEAMRRQQTERAARAWLAIDPKTARTWVEQSDLPPAIKRQLLPSPGL